MNTEKRIALACFIGAAIGALLALQFNKYFWWAGVLIGGGVGYLNYEFGKVTEIIKHARKEMCEAIRLEYDTDFAMMRALLFKVGIGIKVGMMIVSCFFCVMIVGLSWSMAYAALINRAYFTEFSLTYVIVGQIIMSGLMGHALLGMYAAILVQLRKIPTPISYYKLIPRFTRDGNVISVIVWWVPVGLLRFMIGLPGIFRLIRRTFLKSFILIHSEIRLLCMTDAMLGALIGYFCGNALIGGLVGAILGVLNYRLISVRWLKLVPQ